MAQLRNILLFVWFAAWGLAPAQAQVSTEQAELLLESLGEDGVAELLESLDQGQRPGALPPTQDQPLQPAPRPLAEVEEEVELRLEGGDTIIITAFFDETLFDDERDLSAALEEFNDDRYTAKILGRNTLTLDEDGVLNMPGISSIPLAGLSAEEAALRLRSDPKLSQLTIEVRILPLTPLGFEGLSRFGYSLFESVPSTFAPVTEIPIPPEYVLGPGDSVYISLYGNENESGELLVLRDGTIVFPRLGPRPVAGMTFREFKEQLEQWVSEELLGTRVSITIGTLKSIRVFALGEVRQPGSYTVGGLSTMTNALFVSGGVTEIGSLRNVQLRRNGKLINTLDLYDLLLKGDSSQDARLQPGDVIFIPPVNTVVGIKGGVLRPAIYEVNDENSVGQLVALAGGFSPMADRRAVRLVRFNEELGRTILTLDLRNADDLKTGLRAGDLVTIPLVVDELDNSVFLSGHVDRPGGYQWKPGMRISDLLPSESYLKPRSDVHYLLIRGEEGSNRSVTVRSADLRAALRNPGSADDVLLRNRDTVYAFELGVRRSSAVADVIAELEIQASTTQQFPIVFVAGAVHAPGQYPLEPNMRISDLLRAGGKLVDSAYPVDAELARYPVGESGDRETDLIEVDLAAILAGDTSADVLLKPSDLLTIRMIPNWDEQFEVEFEGEVRFAGTYAVRPGETLSSALERAGGLTDLAFAQGAVFTRESLRDREAEQLNILSKRLEADVAALALQVAQSSAISGSVGLSRGGGDATSAFSLGQSLLEQIRSAEPTGRLVINLQVILDNPDNEAVDIVLRPGDRLAVPRRAQEVTVLGEVQFPTSHFYQEGLSRNNFIDSSGGFTVRADKKRVYIVRANGQVVGVGGSAWFGRKNNQIKPGDTIVVPLDTDRVPSLIQWASITQVLFNLAIAVAAVNSF